MSENPADGFVKVPQAPIQTENEEDLVILGACRGLRFVFIQLCVKSVVWDIGIRKTMLYLYNYIYHEAYGPKI